MTENARPSITLTPSGNDEGKRREGTERRRETEPEPARTAAGPGKPLLGRRRPPPSTAIGAVVGARLTATVDVFSAISRPVRQSASKDSVRSSPWPFRITENPLTA